MKKGERLRATAAIYARVSTDDQEDNNSIPDQLRECRAHAERNGLTVTAEYIDIESGTRAERTHLKRLIHDAEDEQFGIVIVKKIDRFGRGPRGFYAPLARLEAVSVKVQFACESYPDSVIPFLVAAGGLEVEQIRERTTAGRKQKARSGRANPAPCSLFGYDFDHGTQTYTINESEAQWVRQMFAWACDGWGLARISAELNRLKVPTRKERRLHEQLANLADPHWCADNHVEDPRSLSDRLLTQLAPLRGWILQPGRLLQHTAYYGEGWANRYIKDWDERPRNEWIPVHYPPIVTRAVFEEAQRVRKMRILPARAGKLYLLSGLLLCTECHRALVGKFTPSKKRLADGRLVSYDRTGRVYRCLGMANRPDIYHCRQPKTIRANQLEQAVWSRIYQGFTQSEVQERVLARIRSQGSAAEEEIDREVTAITKRLTAVDMQEMRILRLYAEGKFSATALDLQHEVITQERSALQVRLGQLEVSAQSQVRSRQQLDWIDEMLQTITTFPEQLSDMVPDQLQGVARLLHILIARIHISGTGHVTIDMQVPTTDVPNDPLEPPQRHTVRVPHHADDGITNGMPLLLTTAVH